MWKEFDLDMYVYNSDGSKKYCMQDILLKEVKAGHLPNLYIMR